MKTNNSFQKNTLFLTLGTVLNKGIQFFAVLLYSRWLTTEEYGQFDLLYTYILLLIPILSLSNQEAVFRFSVNEDRMEKKRIYISSGLFFDITSYLVYLLIAYLVVGRNSSKLYIVFSFYLLSELISVFLRGYLRAIKRLDIYSFALVLQTFFLLLFVTVFVFILNLGTVGILLGYACGTLMGDVILIIWGKLYSYVRVKEVSISRIRELVKYSIPLVPNEISWWVMNASDRQIINIFFGSSANGIFAIAHKIPALCSVIFNMFAISWQQEIVVKTENQEEVNTNEIFNKFLQILFSICACLLTGNFIFYYFFFDIKYFDAILYSPILIASALEMAVAQFLGGIQAAYKRTKSTGLTTLIGAMINVIVHILLINTIGLFAAAISTLCANFVTVFLRVINVRDVFSARIQKSTLLIFAAFIYFFISAFLYRNMFYNFFNLTLSILLMLMVNKKIIVKTFHTILAQRITIKSD